MDTRWITQRPRPEIGGQHPLHGVPRTVPFEPARRGRATLTAAIASTPTCRVGSFGPFHVRRYHRGRDPPPPPRSSVCSRSSPGAVVLRSFGPSYRVGRLLAATPRSASPTRSRCIRGPARYVRIAGRIDAEDEFEDDAHRPLVLRRTRLQVRDGGAWRDGRGRPRGASRSRSATVSTPSPSTPTRSMTASWSSRASRSGPPRMPDRVPAGTRPGDAGAAAGGAGLLGRARDRRWACRRPGRMAAPRMTAGLGRPLVLTTLEPDEAMRVLAGTRSRRPLAAAMCLGCRVRPAHRRHRLGGVDAVL